MRIAWVGLGNNTHNHTAAAEYLGFEHAAIVAPVSHERTRFAATHGIARQYDSLVEMLRDGQVDAVCLDAPCAFHAPHAIACLEAGIAVLVETPMATDADAAREICCAAQNSGSPLMVAHGWRFDDEVRVLKSRIAAGAISSPTHSVVGCQSRALVNAVDRARFLFDDPQPVSVYAHFGGDHGWDSGVVVVAWDNGAASVIEARSNSTYHLRCLDAAYAAQWSHFADCVARRVQPDVNGAHGYLGLCIVDAAYASARTGKVIPL